MKIGILTFHRAYNYGAVLQAFALQQALKKIGADSEIIEYVGAKEREQIKLFHVPKGMGLKRGIKKIGKDFYRMGKHRKFDRFLSKQMTLSPGSYNTFEQMEELDRQSRYDSYVVGSDQVWNDEIIGEERTTFLLSFVSDDCKRNSYAASMGSCVPDEEQARLYQKELSKYRVLTVRENSALDAFPFLRENNAQVVLDPTLLLEKEDYAAIASKRLVKRKYAFLYTVPQADRLRDFAKDYCRQHGLVLIDIKKSFKAFLKSAPEDWLSLMLNADMVFTNSFHGTAFSVIMQKPFVTEVNSPKTKNCRSYDLLEKLDLLNRDMNSASFHPEEPIDYSVIRKKLKAERDRSYLYLRKITLNE